MAESFLNAEDIASFYRKKTADFLAPIIVGGSYHNSEQIVDDVPQEALRIYRALHFLPSASAFQRS